MVADPKLASEVITACRDRDAALNSVLHRVQAHADAAEFEVVREGIAKVLAAIFLDVMDPIYRRHPDLIPAELRSSYGTDGDA